MKIMRSWMEAKWRQVVIWTFSRSLAIAAGMVWTAAIFMGSALTSAVLAVATGVLAGPTGKFPIIQYDIIGAGLTTSLHTTLMCIVSLSITALFVVGIRAAARSTYPEIDAIPDDATMVELLAPFTKRQRLLLVTVAARYRTAAIGAQPRRP